MPEYHKIAKGVQFDSPSFTAERDDVPVARTRARRRGDGCYRSIRAIMTHPDAISEGCGAIGSYCLTGGGLYVPSVRGTYS